MNTRIINIAVLIVSVFVIWQSGVFHAPAQFPEGERAIWAPLDGDWYWGREDGCFANGTVINFQGNEIYVRVKEHEMRYAYELETLTTKQAQELDPDHKSNYKNALLIQGKQHIRLDEPAFDFAVLFEDSGNHLWPVAISVDDQPAKLEGELANQIRPIWNLKRCNNPTPWGNIQSFWRPAYDPGATYTLAEIPLN